MFIRVLVKLLIGLLQSLGYLLKYQQIKLLRCYLLFRRVLSQVGDILELQS
jgi:hypothetical protein